MCLYIKSSSSLLKVCYRNSYRDLLGTAESIVHMDEEMRRAENYLSDIGRRCNTRVLEKSLENEALINRRGFAIGEPSS